MPTDHAVPIWGCNVCGARFGENLAAAERCEAGAVDEALPEGELMLAYVEHRGFRLRRLYVLPGLGTLASVHNQENGHFHTYWLDHPYRRDNIPYPRPEQTSSQHLAPHLPGRLNRVGGNGNYAFTANSSSTSQRVALWPMRRFGFHVDPEMEHLLVGLRHPPTNPTSPETYLRPITPAFAAAFEMLGTTVRAPRFFQEDLRLNHAFQLVAAEIGDPKRAAYVALGRPIEEIEAEAIQLQRRWLAGEDIHAPRASLSCRQRQLSPSKLNKEQRAIVEATGVEWRPRTDGEWFATELMKELTYKMTEHGEQVPLFSAPTVIKVTSTKGGVGKSTVAAGLGVALARAGKRTAIIDLDLTGPSQHKLFEVGAPLTIPDEARILPAPTEVDGLSVFSVGQLVDDGTWIGWNSRTVDEWLTFLGGCLDLSGFDALVLDMPPGHTAVHSALARAGIDFTAILHVTTGHGLALADVERGLPSFFRERPGRHFLVENLSRASGRTASGETADVYLFDDEGAVKALADEHHLVYGGSLPWAPTAIELGTCDAMLALATRLAEATAGSLEAVSG